MQEDNVLVITEETLSTQINESVHGLPSVDGVQQQSLLTSRELNGMRDGRCHNSVPEAQIIGIHDNPIAADTTRNAQQSGSLTRKLIYLRLLRALLGLHTDTQDTRFTIGQSESSDQPCLRARASGGRLPSLGIGSSGVFR